MKLSVAFSGSNTTLVTVLLLVPIWNGLPSEPPLFGMLMLGNVMVFGFYIYRGYRKSNCAKVQLVRPKKDGKRPKFLFRQVKENR